MTLALYLSRNNKRTCKILTDDFKAKPIIAKFIQAQKVGAILSTPEAVIYMYSLLPSIRKEDAIAAINDYFRLNKPREVGKKESILEELGLSCRDLGGDICLSRCLRMK